ncbi:hypothetical protein Ancab_028039 [Ancistrocladus abbreviatus]
MRLRCYGIPLHIWTEEFMQKLISKRGNFVGVDLKSKNRSCFKYAQVQIFANSCDYISASLHVMVDTHIFQSDYVEDSFPEAQGVRSQFSPMESEQSGMRFGIAEKATEKPVNLKHGVLRSSSSDSSAVPRGEACTGDPNHSLEKRLGILAMR